MRKVVKFSSHAWLDYIHWQKNDMNMKLHIDELIKEIIKDPFSGSGYPQALSYDMQRVWSRRLDFNHRFVYIVNDEQIQVIQCRYND